MDTRMDTEEAEMNNRGAFRTGNRRLGVTFLTAGCLSFSVTGTIGSTMGLAQDSRFPNAGSPTELLDRLRDAGPGSIVILEPGDYGDLRLSGFQFETPVTIKARDPSSPPVVRLLRASKLRNVIFDGISFAWAPRPESSPPTIMVDVRSSDGVVFEKCKFSGFVDDDHDNDPIGMVVHSSTRTRLSGNVFHDLNRAALFYESRVIRVDRNELHDLRSDGLDFAGVQDVVISRNTFRNLFPVPSDHPDYIQFWTKNAKLDTTGVRIENNILLQGNGMSSQSIFFGNEVKGRRYKDITITGNVIYQSHPHGISLYDADNVTIERNTLVPFPGGRYVPSINLFRTRDAIVTRNVSSMVKREGDLRTTARNNVILDRGDLRSALSPHRLLLDPYAGAAAGRLSFVPRPDGALAGGTPAGALSVDELARPGALAIRLETFPGSSKSNEVGLEAYYQPLPGIQGKPEYLWSFGDKTGATGPSASHAYRSPGIHPIHLAVRHGDHMVRTTGHVRVWNPVILDLEVRGRPLQKVAADDPEISVATGKDGEAYLRLKRKAEFFGMSELTVAATFRADPATAKKRQILILNHTRYGIELRDGKIVFSIVPREGKGASLQAPAAGLFDGKSHTVAMIYNGNKGTFGASIDGRKVGEKTIARGRIGGRAGWDPSIGGADWGHGFAGSLERVLIATDSAVDFR